MEGELNTAEEIYKRVDTLTKLMYVLVIVNVLWFLWAIL